MNGRSRALNEAHEVGRADHVEIDVEHDVTTLIFGQTVDMLTRAHEALLLCSPEGVFIAHGQVHRNGARSLQRLLEGMTLGLGRLGATA